VTLSTRRAVAYAVLAIVLAGVLAFLELTAAQLAGIDHNIRAVTDNIVRADVTLAQVVRKSSPTVVLDRQVASVVRAQSDIARTMRQVDASLVGTQRSTGHVVTTTAGMEATNAGVERSLNGMSADTAALQTLLAGLVPVSHSTGASLARMGRDARATDQGLRAITAKLVGYGLPVAR
jgi:hypothetical protein